MRTSLFSPSLCPAGDALQAFRDRLKQAEGDVLNANKALQRKDSELLSQKETLQQARAQEAKVEALEEQLAKERARSKELEERVQALQGRVAEAEKAAGRAEALAAELEAAKGREAALLVGGGRRPACLLSVLFALCPFLRRGGADSVTFPFVSVPQDGLSQFRAKADSTSAEVMTWMKRANDAEAVRLSS